MNVLLKLPPLRVWALAALVALWLMPTPEVKAQQLPAYYDVTQLYKEGIELYDREKYSAAQDKFDAYATQAAQLPNTPEYTLLANNARYYAALCSYHLLRADAESRLSAFIAQDPGSGQSAQASFYLAKLYFLQQDYEKAYGAFQQTDLMALGQERGQEAQFMIGYCQFSTGDKQAAAASLAALSAAEGPYYETANYYYGVVKFDLEDYKEALTAFRAIEKTEAYKAKVPFYIALSLLRMGQYVDLEVYGNQLMASTEPVDRKTDILLIIADGLFAKEDYDKATPFYQGYMEGTSSPARPARYKLGFCQYHAQQYPAAIVTLQPLLSGKDTLTQAAAYYTAFSLLKQDKLEEARLQFKKVIDLGLQTDYAQDALFQYAKSSFETNYFAEALSALKTFVQTYPKSPYAGQAKGLMGEVLYYSNNFAEAIPFFESGDMSDLRTRQAYQKACYFYGLGFYDQGNYAEATKYLKKAADNTAEPQMALAAQFWMAEMLFDQGEYLKATAAYNVLVNSPLGKSNNYYARALLGLGWSHFRLDNYTTALQKFVAVTTIPGLGASQPEVYIEAAARAGDCYFVNKQYSQAITEYSKAAGQKKAGADYALYQKALSYARLKDYNNAILTFKQLTDGYKSSALRDDALDQMGSIYLEWLSKPDDAKKLTDQLITEHPGSPLVANAYKRLAKIALNGEDYEACIKYVKAILYEYGDAEGLATLKLLVKLGEVTKPDAQDIEKQFLEKFPQGNALQANLLFEKALETYNEGQYQLAVDELTAFIEQYKNTTYYYDAYNVRGQAYEKLNQNDKALTDYNVCIEAKNAGDAAVKALLYTGALHFRLADYPAAAKAFAEAQKRADQPQDKDQALFGRVSVLLAQKEYDEADKLLATILADGNSSDGAKLVARVQQGYVQYYRNNLEPATKIFAEVVKQGDDTQNRDKLWAQSQYMVARIAYERQDYAGCYKAILYMRDNNPNPTVEWQVRAELLLADYYLSQKRKTEAEQVLSAVAGDSFVEAYYPDISAEAKAKFQQISKPGAGGGSAADLQNPELPVVQGPGPQPLQLIEAPESTLNNDSYEATVSKERVEDLPVVTKTVLPKPTPKLQLPENGLSYATASVAFAPQNNFAAPAVKPLEKEKWEKLYPIHLKLGLGRYLSPLIGLYLHNGRNRRVDWGFNYNHFSTASGQVTNANFGDNNTLLTGKYLLDNHTLYGQAYFQYRNYRFYGDSTAYRETNPTPADSLKQNYIRFEFLAGARRNHDATAPVRYDLPLRLRYYSDRLGRSEFRFSLLPTLQAHIGTQLTLNVPVELSVGTGKYADTTQGTSQYFVQFSPTLQYKNGLLQAHAGVGLGYFGRTDTSRLGVFPLVGISYDVVPRSLTAFAGVSGQLHFNQLYDMAAVNPYTALGINVLPTRETYNIYGGVRGSLFDGLNYQVRLSYRNLSGMQLYYSASQAEGTAGQYGNFRQGYFTVLYENVNEFGVTAQLDYDPRAKFRAGLKLDVRSFSLDSLTAAYHIPGFQTSLYAGYNFGTKFSILTRLNVIGPRTLGQVDVATGGDVLRDADIFFDLNLEAEYRISPMFSVFVEFNNLLNQTYYRWNNYLERPLDFRIGGTLSIR